MARRHSRRGRPHGQAAIHQRDRWMFCEPCRKKSWPTKKIARQMGREISPDMRAYQCPHDGEWWHYSPSPPIEVVNPN